MKNTLFSILMILVATLFAAVIPTEAEGAVYADTVRLHILAESDSTEDQMLKLMLRDTVLAEFGQELSQATNADGARDMLGGRLSEIEDFCEGKIREHGYDYAVSVTLDEEWYDTREYEGFTLPSGTYTSLRIVIGSGSGQNWWCVMFPPLCLDAAVEDAPSDDAVKKYSDEEITLISGNGYNAKFKILELIADAFS